MLLELLEALVDGLPARGDEVDEEAEVVDACVALGQHVALEPLEPPEHLVHEAANLGQLPGDRARLAGDALLDRGAHLLGQAGLELGGNGREVLEALTRPLERRFDVRRLGPPFRRLGEASPSSLDRVLIHRVQG